MLNIGMNINGRTVRSVIGGHIGHHPVGAVILLVATDVEGQPTEFVTGRVSQAQLDSEDPVREWENGKYFNVARGGGDVEKQALAAETDLLRRAGFDPEVIAAVAQP